MTEAPIIAAETTHRILQGVPTARIRSGDTVRAQEGAMRTHTERAVFATQNRDDQMAAAILARGIMKTQPGDQPQNTHLDRTDTWIGKTVHKALTTQGQKMTQGANTHGPTATGGADGGSDCIGTCPSGT